MSLVYLQLSKGMQEFWQIMVRYANEPIGAWRDRILEEDIWVSGLVFAYDAFFPLSVRRSSLTKSPSCDRLACWIWWWYQIGEDIVKRDQVDELSPYYGSIVSRTDTSWRVYHSHFFGVISDLVGSEAFWRDMCSPHPTLTLTSEGNMNTDEVVKSEEKTTNVYANDTFNKLGDDATLVAARFAICWHCTIGLKELFSPYKLAWCQMHVEFEGRDYPVSEITDVCGIAIVVSWPHRGWVRYQPLILCVITRAFIWC
jgi:hypothetical protein